MDKLSKGSADRRLCIASLTAEDGLVQWALFHSRSLAGCRGHSPVRPGFCLSTLSECRGASRLGTRAAEQRGRAEMAAHMGSS